MKRTILMLEHDEDDRYITQAVFDENHYNVDLQFVLNDQELIGYLQNCERKKSALPSLILLNYHAHPLTAVQILKDLKTNPAFKHIPLVVLSGSVNEAIVKECYREGANSFIQKPSSGNETTSKISSFIKYWFETVELI